MSGIYRLTAQPDAGVLVDVVEPDLEVQVRSCGPARRSLKADRRPAGDDHAASQSGRVTQEMAVDRRISIAVDHQQHVAVADRSGVFVHDTGVSRDDLGSIWPRDIESGVDLVRVGTGRV